MLQVIDCTKQEQVTVAICAQRVERRGIDVPANDEPMKLLLISDGSEQAALLRQLMEQQGLQGEIRRMDQGRSAVACARQSGPYRGEPPPDVVLLDFTQPNRRSMSVVKHIALGGSRVTTPVVLLTGEASDDALHSKELRFDDSKVFAPTSLNCFIRKMQQHSRERFLRALAVMSDLGPILVRLPPTLVRQNGDDAALSA